VAAGSEYATEAGMRMFHSGGNAVDAGIATMLAASVSEFSHFGLGGESPILVRTKEGKVFAIAGVGTMPKLATADFYRKHQLLPEEIGEAPAANGLKDWVPVSGILSALVPGMVEAALVTLREFGTKSFSAAVEPAIELADGFPIDEMRVSVVRNSMQYLQRWPASRNVFLPNGQPPQLGYIFRQPDLARTLRSMAAVEKKALAGGASLIVMDDGLQNPSLRRDFTLAVIDGGVHSSQRAALLRENRVILMTPDVLHAWLLSHLNDPAVAEAAVIALGEIASPEARRDLATLRQQPSPVLSRAVAAASLGLAADLAAHDQVQAAAGICRDLLAPAWPKDIRRGAFLGLLRLEHDGGERRIIAALQGGDAALKPAAIAAMTGIKGTNASQRFAAELPKRPPTERALLIETLAERHDPVAQKSVVQQMASQDAAVRLTTIAALG